VTSKGCKCGSGISDGLANRVLVKTKRASLTPRESLAANLLLYTNERIPLRREGFIKLDESLHGVTVVVPPNDREIPGSIPRRYNLQIKITSTS